MRDFFAAHAAAPVPSAVQVFLGGIADWFIYLSSDGVHGSS
jgi:hypothetical protein